MKKFFAVLLAAALFFTAAVPALAEDDDLQYENDFIFDVEETETGPTLIYVGYTGSDEEVYIPETLGGIPFTPETIMTFDLFYGNTRITAFTVDEDNPYFSVRDGVLYNKAGDTLLRFPIPEGGAIFTVPDGVQTLAPNSFELMDTLILAIPDSVTQLDGLYGLWNVWALHLAGTPGSVAEQFAADHDIPFTALGEGHTHEYLRLVTKENTCISDGAAMIVCPCGDVQEEITLDMDPDAHHWECYYSPETNQFTFSCSVCGKPYPEKDVDPSQTCDCFCHQLSRDLFPSFKGNFAGFIKDFMFRLKLVIWRLTGKHQYCECGARHY